MSDVFDAAEAWLEANGYRTDPPTLSAVLNFAASPEGAQVAIEAGAVRVCEECSGDGGWTPTRTLKSGGKWGPCSDCDGRGARVRSGTPPDQY